MTERRGIGGTNSVDVNTDDLVSDLARYRDALPSGESKRLVKRATRRLEKLERLEKRLWQAMSDFTAAEDER